MFHLIFGLPWLLVVTRFLLPLPWAWWLKLAVALVLLVASQYHWFSKLSSGSVFAPEFSRLLIIGFNLLLGAMILLAVMLIVLDVVSLVLALFKGRFPVVPPGLRYVLGAAALGLAGFGVSQAIRVPALKDVEIVLPGLPAAFDGYRLVHLTDLHISRLFPRPWTESVVAATNRLDADLILITGDLIDGSVEMRRDDVAPLAGLTARDGVFVSPGNHEYFFGYETWMQHFEGLGMRRLNNSHQLVTRGGESLVIAGVTDLSAARAGEAPPDLAAALAGAPRDVPLILLDHQPREAAKAAAAGVSLQLSGHVHGGMIVGLDRLVGRFNNGFTSGLYPVGGMQLYLNNGTALWPGFALRIGIPAELTRITLRAGG